MYDILRNLLQDHKGDVIFKCFGIWHFLIMLIIFSGIALTVLLLKNKSKETKQKAIKTTINIAFGLYILDFFLMPFAYGTIDIEKLPFHICTITCVLCFFSRHNKFFNKYKQQFALLGLVGNLIYVIYPAGVGWYQIAPYSYRVIQTLTYHGVMTLYGILTLTYDDVNLDIKKSFKELIVIMCLVLWAMIGNYMYNSDVRLYNWFFVVQDPFYMLPSHIAPFVMPFIITLTIYIAVIIVYFISHLIKKITK